VIELSIPQREGLELSASSDAVVTCSMGTSNFCTEASDSPSVPRNFETALPSVDSTCSLLEAFACS
jgi:hypothetical protein